MALDALYVLDLQQRFGQQEIHNIFTFEGLDTHSAVELNAAFQEDLLPKIVAIQSNQIANVGLNTICLGNLGDNSFVALTGGGSFADGPMLPLHDAINFTLKPASRVVRPGSKRFSGIPKLVDVNGDVSDSTYVGNLNTLKTALDSNISDDDISFYAPVVIKRVKYDVPGSDPVRTAYRFPKIGETPVYSQLAGVLLNLHISHQVSRQ